MSQPDGLSQIVGKENLATGAAAEAYAADRSFTPPLAPQAVVRLADAAGLPDLVRWAAETKTPLVPVSSGPPHFRGDTVPAAGGAVIVDMSGLKKIISLDRRNRLAVIEPGVTYAQLQPVLAKEGMRLSTTLLPRANKSVLASLLEREPRLLPHFQWGMLDPLRCLEIVYGDGETVQTGEAAHLMPLAESRKKGLAPTSPVGPWQTDCYRLVSAAQGSMGLVTWASVKCEVLPQVHKLYLVPAEKPADLFGLVYKLLKLRFGDELFILNANALAAVTGKDRAALPEWVALVGIAGRDIFPEERAAYQEQDISEMAAGFGLKLMPELPGLKGSELLETIMKPSPEPYWKGNRQEIFFLTTLDKTPPFISTMDKVAKESGYPAGDIGVYLQPVHQGAACHCEFLLPFDRDDAKEASRMEELYAKASRALLEQGAYYSRPYGLWADLAYGKDAPAAAMLRTLKGIFDPDNILNPGRLCF